MSKTEHREDVYPGKTQQFTFTFNQKDISTSVDLIKPHSSVCVKTESRVNKWSNTHVLQHCSVSMCLLCTSTDPPSHNTHTHTHTHTHIHTLSGARQGGCKIPQIHVWSLCFWTKHQRCDKSLQRLTSLLSPSKSTLTTNDDRVCF